MAGGRQHGWRAIPAVRSEYGADTLPIETIQTAGAEQSVQQCTMLAAVIATEEHVDDMTFNILTIALVGYSRGGHHALGKYCGLRRAGCA